jgi:uncharacterized protein YxeA
MKKIIFFLLALTVSMFTVAQTNLSQSEFQKLPVEVQQQILSVKQNATTDQQIENIGKWVGLGKEVGLAVNESLSAVTKTASDFAETDLGKLTVGLVIWKVVGHDILQISFGLLWLILIFGISGFVYHKYAKTRRYLIKETYNEETKVKEKEWETEQGYDDWRITSVLILCVGIIADIIIIFA